MNVTILKLLTVSTSVLFLLCSCGSTDENRNGELPAEGKNNGEYRFKLMPELNRVYKYEVTNENSTEQEVNDTKSESETKIEMLLSYTVSRDSSGLYDFSMKYDKFRLAVKALEQEKLIDMDNAAQSFDPAERMFGAFKEAVINLKTDEKGNVKTVYGFNELADKMRKLSNGNPDALQMLNTSILHYIGKDNIRNLFEQSFKLLPDSSLREGNEWVVPETITSDFNAKVNNIYQVKSIKGGEIAISSQKDIDIKDQPAVVEGTTVNTTLKGGQTGESKIETATGMLIFSSSSLKLKGEIVVMGRTVPIKIAIKNVVKQVEPNK